MGSLSSKRLSVYASSHFEELLQRLLYRLIQPLPSPFDQEIVLIGDPTQGKWLENYIAEHLTICSNIHFETPLSYLWSLYADVLPALHKKPIFIQPETHWRVFEFFIHHELPTPLCHYIEKGNKEKRCYELARQICQLFDRYLLYRPGWLKAWRKRHTTLFETNLPNAQWQSTLWRQLLESNCLDVEEVLLNFFPEAEFFKALSSILPREKLPHRMTLFGVHHLPPECIDILCELSQWIDITCFLYDPFLSTEDNQPLALETHESHPLFGRWGHENRLFRNQWRERDGRSVYIEDSFVSLPAQTESLLSQIQTDILLNRLPNSIKKRSSTTKTEVDRSIQHHICCSAMREFEVLHDQLLLMIEEEGVLPNDILVLIPNLQAAQPFIEAVFGAAPRSRYIPYGVSERKDTQTAAPFCDLFATLCSRFELNRLIPFLHNDAIIDYFEIPVEEIDTIIAILQQAGIRWGVDQTHRQDTGFKHATSRHSWRYGIGRLMLGYAMPEQIGTQFSVIEETLAEAWLEGQEAQGLLSPVLTWLETLFDLANQIPRQAASRHWLSLLRSMGLLFEKDENVTVTLRSIFQYLEKSWETLSADTLLSPELVLTALNDAVNSLATTHRNLSDGVIFGSIGHFRQIPYKVICLVGLNYECFPRPQAALDFDLLNHPNLRLPTDPDSKKSDRGAMLDALLAAQQCFYISITGFSNQSQDKLPVSIIVSEWLELLKHYEPQKPLVLTHPLHPFSREYDGNDHKVTFAEEYTHKEALLTPNKTWFHRPLTQMDTIDSIDWTDLLSFYRHPVRFFCRRQLGISIPYLAQNIQDTEPFLPTHNIEFDRRLLSMIEVIEPEKLTSLIKASIHMPSGLLGDIFTQQKINRYIEFWSKIKHHLKDNRKKEPIDFKTIVNDITLLGEIDQLTETGWMGFEMTKLSARHLVQTFLHALLLAHLENKEDSSTAYWFAADQSISITVEKEDALPLLKKFIYYYQKGLSHPLAFFPKSSWEYVTSSQQSNPFTAMAWISSSYQKAPGEGEDAWNKLVFKNIVFPTEIEGFEKIALDLLEPLYSRITKISSNEK